MTETLNLALRAIGLVGLLLFAGLFSATFVSGEAVERAGQAFIRYQVEKEVRATWGRTAESSYGKALQRLKDKHEFEARQIQGALDDNLSVKIANVIAAMCRLDCKQRQSLQDSIEAGFEARLAATGVAVDTLSNFIKGRYLAVVANLTRDVRIFLGSNAILFLVITALALVKPRAAVQLYLPAVILLVSTVISAGLYVFGQNWFFTILYNDYVGFGYIAYVGVLFAFLCDIAFNRARVTTKVVKAILESVGSAVQVVPC